MRRGSRAAAFVTAAITVVALATLPGALGGCATSPADDVASAPVAAAPASRDPRLRADCGGWVPASDLLDTAAALVDPAWKDDVEAALESSALGPKIDVLRAGLRLADDAAARACAARLEWQWIDRWECARCVELLLPVVLAPETDSDVFHTFRSYLGSVELPAFLAALPPPGNEEAPQAVSQVHRIFRAAYLPEWCRVARSPDPEVARVAAVEMAATMLEWTDEHREDVAALWLGLPPEAATAPVSAGAGLHPLLRGLLEHGLDGIPGHDERDEKMAAWLRRWCLDASPSPADEDLLTTLAEERGDDVTGKCAVLLLGKLHGDRSGAALRRLADADPKSAAWRSLAVRGDAAAIEHVAASANERCEDLAAFMAAAPERAQPWIEERLLGADESAADDLLDVLDEFLPPGAWSDADGHDFRLTSFAGVAALAATAPMSAVRRARIGIIVPGCRTRAVAEAVCRDLVAETARGPMAEGESEDDVLSDYDAAAFLETAAPDAFRAALRAIAGGPTESRDRIGALGLLLLIGDPASGADFVAWAEQGEIDTSLLARSSCPEVRAFVARQVAAALPAGEPVEDDVHPPLGLLARIDGAPEEVAFAFEGAERIPGVADDVLAGRWREALHRILDAQPIALRGDSNYLDDVGVLRDDDRVRSYLRELRTQRGTGLYWYATGQLAAMGDADARAEFWGAMQDGRYRIVDEQSTFARTLGYDLEATMPFWISELQSNCCRVAAGDGGDIVEKMLGLTNWGNTQRTAYARARELWDAAGGRFVRSRIAEHFVPAPR